MDVVAEPLALDDQVSAAVAEFQAGRAVIEQAKGMLMVVYGVDADGAFDMLRQQSQKHNVKLRLVAEQIVGDLPRRPRSEMPLRFGGETLRVTAGRCTSDTAARRALPTADTA